MDSQRFENIGWTIGNYCNASCGHCYSWEVRRDSRAFLTHSDIRRVVAQLKSLGIKTANLGGNEPVYTDGPDIRNTRFPFIIRTLNEANIPVGLTTNATSFV
jgi:MoaA/NifB/PqqE/SkfB family radical SAM enzyme